MTIAIIGAGMSGLSLAVALAERGLQAEVHEAADAPPSARTFSGFDVERHPFANAVSHRWSRVKVASAAGVLERELSHHPYVTIDGPDFVEEALRRLEGARVRPCFGSRIDDLSALDATHVFDSRPAPTPGALLQQFEGRFVRMERPVFDPGCATLMDFRLDQSLGVHFLYVLPTSPTEALVEDTYFTRHEVAPATFARTLDQWLAPLGPHEVTRTERGVIPMHTEPPPPAPARVTRIGLAGGVAKPSTGYAFLFAQRHAAAIADALARGEDPPATVRRERDRLLDAIFLARIDADPTAAHQLFHRLFEAVDPDRIARFLSECASPRDLIAVMRALPAGPFTRQAIRTLAAETLGRGRGPL